jgi:uncharacterized protein (DUF2062 family)
MGIVPLWGFQLIIAIAASIFFKLNKALVIIAANISIPPMLPLILFLSHRTGAVWMGAGARQISFNDEISLKLVHNHFVQYVLGGITLSIAAGLASGLLTFVVLKIFRKR